MRSVDLRADVSVSEARQETLRLWNNFLDSFDEQLLILITVDDLWIETKVAISTIKEAIDRTFGLLDRLLSGDPKKSYIEKEYSLVVAISNLLKDYNPRGDHSHLNSLRAELRKTRALRNRL